RHRHRWNEAVGRRLTLSACRFRQQINHAVAVIGHEGVDINQLRDSFARAVGDAGRDHAAIGVTDQADVGQILELDHAENIRNMRVEIDVGMRQVSALTQPGQRRRDQTVPARAHQRVHFLPAPAGAPGAVRNNESGHRPPPFYSAATVRVIRLFHLARTKSTETTTSPALRTCQPGLMPASKSNAASSTRIGDTWNAMPMPTASPIKVRADTATLSASNASVDNSWLACHQATSR